MDGVFYCVFMYKAMGVAVCPWLQLCWGGHACVALCPSPYISTAVAMWPSQCVQLYVNRFLGVHMPSYGGVYIYVAVYKCTAMSVW